MVQRCPVCGGRGTVSQGFYSGQDTWVSSDTKRETCRSCDGRGIVFDPTYPPAQPMPTWHPNWQVYPSTTVRPDWYRPREIFCGSGSVTSVDDGTTWAVN
jgi:hypothetical protein